MSALMRWSDKQIALIKKTVAKDCDRNSRGEDLHLGEFDWAMEICRQLQLDPLRRQIYFFCFHKDDASKRQMVPVIGIGGYRTIAARAGDYRPGKAEIVFDERLKDKDCNPLGISHATVTVFKYVHGEWHEFTDTAHWDEFAPLKERWEDNKPTGKFYLDPKKEGWRKMPRLMIEKCAEAKALRRGWPENLASTYAEEEIDKHQVIDLTPTEMAERADQARRFELVGGPNSITVQWEEGAPLARVSAGQFGDETLKFISRHMKAGEEEPSVVLQWSNRNRESLKQFWAIDKDAALAIKQAVEKVEAFARDQAKEAAE
jgi:phage recombination protein Bet